MWTTVSGGMGSWGFVTLKLVMSEVALVALFIDIFCQIHQRFALLYHLGRRDYTRLAINQQHNNNQIIIASNASNGLIIIHKFDLMMRKPVRTVRRQSPNFIPYPAFLLPFIHLSHIFPNARLRLLTTNSF
jgi:hypothetical protein